MHDAANILVVDDDARSRDVFARLLRSRTYVVEEAADGPAALAAIEAHRPDLLLLDISMPGMSGLDVLEVVRRDHGPDVLPVILVTAFGESEDVVRGLEAGANDYVAKPINPAILLARIDAALRVRLGRNHAVEAEHHRGILDAIDETCRQLREPVDRLHEAAGELGEGAVQDSVRTQVQEVAALLDRFERLAALRDQPWTTGTGGFIAASLTDRSARAEESE